MRKDEPNVGISRRRTAKENARDRARRIGPELNQRRRQLGLQVLAALSLDRMQKHHGFATVELAHDRIECRISWVFPLVARHEADAVGIQRVQSIFNFVKRPVDIR
jgi:hypothetical protein